MNWPSNNNSLYHYGIPHMQWHKRRFQNADGTLTPEGKLRYAKNSDKKDTKSSDNIVSVVGKTKYSRGKQVDKEFQEISLREYNQRLDSSKELKKYAKNLEEADRKYQENYDKYHRLKYQIGKDSDEYARKAIVDKYGNKSISELEHYKTTRKKVRRIMRMAGAATIAAAYVYKKKKSHNA